MPKVAEVLGLATHNEFHRLDVAFYDPENTALLFNHDDIEVAVELENDIPDAKPELQVEVLKLAKLGVPLKILITFATDRKIQALLPVFTSIASSQPEFNEGRLLVVFGPYGMTSPQQLDWSYY